MRRLLPALILALALPAYAQQAGKPALEPLPPPPAPTPGMDFDPALEPQVTILKRGTDTVEEYRLNGRLYMMKVIPAYGPPYFLIDEKGDGKFTRQDSYDAGIRPPMWTIFSW